MRVIKPTLFGVAAAANIGIAHADSSALSDFSAADFGRANAGRVTYLDDAGVAYANPALMSYFAARTATFQLSGIYPDGGFNDQGSIDALGAPLGSGAKDVFTGSLIPSAYLVWPVSEKVALGLSVNTPFGLATDYDPAWAGRYQAVKSELKTININPSVSYRMTDQVSVAAGVSLQYAEATLSNAVDFGAVCLGALDPASCAGLGLLPQAADGFASLTGDDWSVGYNIGASWTPHEALLFGVHYRSEIDHVMEGTADFTVPASATPLTAGGSFADTGFSADFILPASADIGVRWQACDTVALYATAQWMDWSAVQSIDIVFDNPAQPVSSEVFGYDDAYRYGVGADFEATEKVTLRAGLARDTVPSDGPLPTARIPDADRWVYAMGFTYQYSDQMALNASVNHIAFDDAQINRTGQFGETLTGDFDIKVPAFSLSLNWQF